MKNIHIKQEKLSRMPQGLRRGARFLVLCLALCLPTAAFAQEGFPGDQVDSRLNRVLQDGGQQSEGRADEGERDGAFIGTDEEGDSVMSTGRPRPQSGGVGHYEDGLIIAPQVEPIIPMPPRKPMPLNPYPGPGPHPRHQPRDGVNQLHEYNYNPEYPQEVPRRPFGGMHP